MDIRYDDRLAKPLLIQRSNGGWLAIAPKTALFSIGVTAATAEEAGAKFSFAYRLWVSLWEAKDD